MAGIKEQNLPVATELNEGDKVRIVTSGGNSKQIDASAIGGGGVFIVNKYYDPDDPGVSYLNKTFGEIKQAFLSGQTVFLLEDGTSEDPQSFSCSSLYKVSFYVDGYSHRCYGSVIFQVGDYAAEANTLELLDESYPYLAV